MRCENAKIRSIRMTDTEFEMLKRESSQRKLAMGKFIRLLCEENQSYELSPEIICRLQTVRNLLNVPQSEWNKEMTAMFNDSVSELCGMLKW